MAKDKEQKIVTDSLNLHYGQKQALRNVSMRILARRITALIGPSGCGKSSFLRTINRMNDLIPNAQVSGSVYIDNSDIYAPDVDVVGLRKRVGMVFQSPNPFPRSIYDNVAYGPTVHGVRNKSELNDIVERSLQQAALWEEVKDRLQQSALKLSGGEQQRLCIARAVAVDPEILLMDEPCSALDPISTTKIEELMLQLCEKYTLVFVTHNLQQAARVSEYTAFFYLGELIEFDRTRKIFTNPAEKNTEEYVTGRFG